MSKARFWIRLALFYGALLLVGRFAAGHWLWAGISPHPFLLPVTWASLRYGWLEGLLAAGLGSALLSLGSRGQLYWLPLWALWLGALVGREQRRIRQLRREAARDQDRCRALEEQVEVLQGANAQLRQQFQERDQEQALVYQIAGQLFALTPGSPPESRILEVLASALGAERCSYYRPGPRGELLLAAQIGWTLTPAELQRVQSDQDLVKLASQRKSLQTLKDYPLEGRAPQEADQQLLRLLAAPIVHPGLGTVLGVLSVESLPFVRFTRANAELMLTICDIAGKALAQLQLQQPRQPRREVLLAPAALLRQISQELGGFQRGSRPLFSLVALEVQQCPDSGRAALERALALVGQVNLRASDRIGSYQDHFVILLPNASANLAERLAWEIPSQLSRYLPLWLPQLPELLWSVSWLSGDQASEAEVLLQQLKIGLQPWHRLQIL